MSLLPTATTMEGIVLLGTALLAALVLHTISQWHRLSHVPGPLWAAVSKYWMIKEALRGRQPRAIEEVNDNYGSLVRIGPDELATDDPEVLRRIMAVRSPYKRGPVKTGYDAWRPDPTRDNLFSMRDDEAHARLRNQMVAGENMSMETTIETQIARLIELTDTKYLSTETECRPMNFAQRAQFFALDVMLRLAGQRTISSGTGTLTGSADFIRHGLTQGEASGKALMGFNKIFVELLRRFDFSIVSPALLRMSATGEFG
ncbi:hypothetical protein VTK56DRAFT_5981 [Thermocarpiscus australiensis]